MPYKGYTTSWKFLIKDYRDVKRQKQMVIDHFSTKDRYIVPKSKKQLWLQTAMLRVMLKLPGKEKLLVAS
ncbi:hypothetical protein AB6735_20205 [Mucilaginibacter sp. RCC_168]|uniref:hypothetical protein n=1 Tax=Mucilaginibacter sp. RCC_168 TaxID=3239221 RepID=UPI0035265726